MKLVLIGDSIRHGYQHSVILKLRDRMQVWGPQDNGRHCMYILDHFYPWIQEPQPDILHINCGIHDAACGIYDDNRPQVLPEQYRVGIRRIIQKTRKCVPYARILWATTTPRLLPREDVPFGKWKFDPDIEKYNAIAREVMDEEHVPLNDLHRVILDSDYTRCIQKDGCHMTAYGYEALADAVVRAVLEVSGRGKRKARRS